MCYTVKPDLFFANFFAYYRKNEVQLKEVYKVKNELQFILNKDSGPNPKIYIDLNNDEVFKFANKYEEFISINGDSIHIKKISSFELVTEIKNRPEDGLNWRLPNDIKEIYINFFKEKYGRKR